MAPVGAALTHADRRADGHDEAIAIYTNTPKNASYFAHCVYTSVAFCSCS